MSLENYNPADTLLISMFGNLELSYGDQIITENSNHSRKLWTTLAFIITYRHKSITLSEFIDSLWSSEEITNPVNSVKTTLYRIRNLLKSINPHHKEFILTSYNSYRWNNSIKYILDTELFESYIKDSSDNSLTNSQKIKLLQKAIYLYKGEFLANHSTELWAIPIAVHYHSHYVYALKTLLQLQESEKMYEEMVTYCTQAIQIDPFDEELHALLIKSLIYKKDFSAACKHYKVATDILYHNLGVPPSEELRSLYIQVKKIQNSLETDLDLIQYSLNENIIKHGAFVCDYGFFQEIYQLEVRQAAREHLPICLCLMTLSQSNGDSDQLDLLNNAMNSLLLVISCCLRKSDVVSRYSGTQYIIILPNTTYDSCNIIMERIVISYHKKNHQSILRLQFNAHQIEVL